MKKNIIFFLLAILGCVKVYADDVVFQASAPNAVVVGQQFRLMYTANNADVKNFRIPDVENFDVLMGPTSSTSTNISIVNGKRSQEVQLSYSYILLAKEEGEFTLPAATAKIKGGNYTSNTVKIKVLPADKPAAAEQRSAEQGELPADAVFIRTIVSTNSTYEQAPVLVTYKLYNRGARIIGFENIKFPEFEGFLAQEITLPDEKPWNLEHYNGVNYNSVVIKQTLLFPQRSGKLTLPSGNVDVITRVQSNRRARSFFDDPFSDYTDVRKALKFPTATVDVKPLPSGRPASFYGTVGDIKMTSSINTTQLKANESLTLKIEISGTGNIRLIKAPEISFPVDFDVYDPTIKSDIKTTTSSLSGKQTFEYLAIPRHAGEFTIPAVEFSYFDLKTGVYKTLKTEVYNIIVEAGEGGNGQTVVSSNFTNKEDLKYLGKDIRYIRTDDLSLKPKGSLFFGTIWYWLFYIIPVLLFAIFLYIYRKQAKENANIALSRVKKANKVASKRLKQAGGYLKENKKEEFYEEIMRALWGYISDKLNMPLSVLSKDNVGAELMKYGADESFIKEFMDILHTSEFARYAPGSGDKAMDELYNRAVNVINKMESTIKK